MITGLDLAIVHSQGLMWIYLEEFNNDPAKITEIVELSVQVADTVRNMPDDEDVDTYLRSVEFPDIDHTKYWMLGLENPDYLFGKE
jgi:hypothetical protein